MTIFALLSLITSIVFLIMGHFVLYKNPRSTVHRLYMFICLMGFYNAFTEFGYRQADSYETAYIWMRCSSLWPFMVPLLLHFILVFTGNTKILKNKATYFFIYFPPAVFFLIDLTTNLNSGNPIKEYWGWTYGNPENLFVYLVIFLWYMGIMLLCFYLSIRYYFQQTTYKRKMQVKLMLIGFSFPFIAIIGTEWIPPLIQHRIPELTSSAFTITLLFIAYAIWKYKLFILSPESVAEVILETMADFLILTNQQGNIVSINSSTVKTFGYSRDELIGQKIYILSTDRDQKTLWEEKIFNKLNEQDSLNDFETNLKMKDGKSIPVSISSSLIRDEDDDTPKGILWIGRDISMRKKILEELDQHRHHLMQMVAERTEALRRSNEQLRIEITERKKIEHTLTESEKKYRTLFDSIPDGIVIASLDGRIIDANPSYLEMLGYTFEELKNKMYYQLTPERWHAAEKDAIQSLSEKGYGTFEKEYIRKDGTIFPVALTGWIIKGEQGSPLKMGAYIKDITEQKRLMEQIKQSHKMESMVQLAGAVAHSLNNILSGLVTYPDLILREMDQNNPLRKKVETIKKSGQRASAFVEDLLNIAQGNELSSEIVNINDLIIECINSPEINLIRKNNPAINIDTALSPFLNYSTVKSLM